MSDRMTDERLAELDKRLTELDKFLVQPFHRELLDALGAERAEVERLEARVVRLEAALTDLTKYALHPGELVPTPLRIERFYAALDKAAAVLAEGATT